MCWLVKEAHYVGTEHFPVSAKTQPLLEKIAVFLEVTQAQREHHLQRHKNLHADSISAMLT